MVDAVGLDERVVDVDDQADGRGRLLRDADLADIVGLDRVGLVLQDGVELGLEDVDVDAARIAQLAESVFAQRADVEHDPGEVGVGVAAQVDDLGPRVVLASGGGGEGQRQRQRREERGDRALKGEFQLASIL